MRVPPESLEQLMALVKDLRNDRADIMNGSVVCRQKKTRAQQLEELDELFLNAVCRLLGLEKKK